LSYLLCLGNTARHPQLLHPSADELNDTRRDRVKVNSLVNTGEYTTFIWAYTRTFKEMEKKRDPYNSIANAFDCNPMQCDAVFLKKNRK
jgi:hypothetical protein